MRMLVRDYLEPEGFEVEDWLPMSIMEIPERIESSKPDLILTDFRMPGVNGLSVAQAAQRANAALPVVVLTALREPETEARLLKFGVKRILYKPITKDTLVQALREILPVGTHDSAPQTGDTPHG
jgi:CheY-like chemotaxis protein